MTGLVTAPVRASQAPVGQALRLAGLLGLVAQAVTIVLQFVSFPWRDALGGAAQGQSVELLPASVRVLQLLVVLATLIAAWHGRRGLVWAGAGGLLALSAMRLALNVPSAGTDPREVISWLTGVAPLWGAAIFLAVGFRAAIPNVSRHERAVWVRSAPVGAVVLCVLSLAGRSEPLPHTWTLVYAALVLVLVLVEVVLARRAPVLAVETAATWYALALLAVLVLPVQFKDLVLPVQGRSPWVVLGEVAVTVVAALLGLYGGVTRSAEPVAGPRDTGGAPRHARPR